MDKIRVITNRPMCFDAIATPAGTLVELAPLAALDVINSRRGELVDPQDAQRLRRWATAQGSRQSFTNAY